MRSVFSLLLILSLTQTGFALDPEKMYHFRSGDEREWDRYSSKGDASQFLDTFDWLEVAESATLRISQVDVKQRWEIKINGEKIGRLLQDENPMVVYYEFDSAILREKDNRLEVINIERNPKGSDDIVIGRMQVFATPLEDLLGETRLRLNVTEQGTQTPARITVLNEHWELQTVGAESGQTLAVRPGTIYTSNGAAEFGLPAGRYTIYAGRGFEYSLPSTVIEISEGQRTVSLEIERQVDTTGYVACDTHVHTLTHSGHGDSTVQERMITLAGEGVELPIATDHNVQINHRPFAKEMAVSQHFTPVPGNEVTTPVGHFNIFPARANQEIPNHKLTDWAEIFAEIERTTQAPIIILNHARDIHSGVTPFGPKNYLSIVAESLDDQPIGFNAMEVINSGATQTDPLQLTRDWMNLLNAGHRITPVGSSDSHDVARHFVGQGRTYARCDDSNPAHINVNAAISAFQNGDVAVSYGLLTFLSTEPSKPDAAHVELQIDVRSPDWIDCDRIRVFANGNQIAELKGRQLMHPESSQHQILKTIHVKKPSHDTIFVAVATGPGTEEPYWKTAFPYQPDSDQLQLKVLGISRAVYFDADGDGKLTSANEYAHQIFERHDGDLNQITQRLVNFDAAVAVHVAHLYQKNGGSFEGDEYQSAMLKSSSTVKEAFDKYFHDWRASQMARLQSN